MRMLAPWRALLAEPGLRRSVGVSLFVGFATTVVSLAAVMVLTASFMGRPGFAVLRRFLSPLLALPHVALAFGELADGFAGRHQCYGDGRQPQQPQPDQDL